MQLLELVNLTVHAIMNFIIYIIIHIISDLIIYVTIHVIIHVINMSPPAAGEPA